jgi:hypothetical protein
MAMGTLPRNFDVGATFEPTFFMETENISISYFEEKKVFFSVCVRTANTDTTFRHKPVLIFLL